MNITRSRKKVKKKALAQRKKVRGVGRKGKKKPAVSVNTKRKTKKTVSVNTRRKQAKRTRRPTRAQLEKQLAAAQQKLERLKVKPDRTAAAKKGWETRRKNLAERAAKAIKVAETSEGIVFSSIDKAKVDFLKRPEIRQKVQDLYIEKLPEFFIEGERWVEQKEPSIIRRLIYAEVEGEFDEVAHEIAEEYGYEPNEIYSLWHGYKLPD